MSFWGFALFSKILFHIWGTWLKTFSPKFKGSRPRTNVWPAVKSRLLMMTMPIQISFHSTIMLGFAMIYRLSMTLRVVFCFFLIRIKLFIYSYLEAKLWRKSLLKTQPTRKTQLAKHNLKNGGLIGMHHSLLSLIVLENFQHIRVGIQLSLWWYIVEEHSSSGHRVSRMCLVSTSYKTF